MKTRVTLTLDVDVVDRLGDYAESNRISRSAMINRILAEKMGLSEIANRPISDDERKQEPK